MVVLDAGHHYHLGKVNHDDQSLWSLEQVGLYHTTLSITIIAASQVSWLCTTCYLSEYQFAIRNSALYMK